MITHRIIEQDTSGKWYATNAITIIYEDMDGQHQVFFLDPQGTYETVFNAMNKMSATQDVTDDAMPEDMRTLKRTLVKVMRSAVKGVLIAYGDNLLTMFYGTKDHPKPPKVKNLDLIQWYIDQFTRVAIAHMMRSEFIFSGQHIEVGSHVISVNQVTTRPIPGPNETETADGNIAGSATTIGAANGHVGETGE